MLKNKHLRGYLTTSEQENAIVAAHFELRRSIEKRDVRSSESRRRGVHNVDGSKGGKTLTAEALRLAPSMATEDSFRRIYPAHDWTAVVTTCGRICYQRRKSNLSQVFGGQKVGVKQVDDHRWLVTFMHYDLGYFDDETCRLEPIDNPFGPKLLPMSPE